MKTFLLTLLGVLFACAVHAGPDRVSFLIGSHHVNAQQSFDEVNPGVFVTWENPRLHWTVGAYRNSYGRASISATAGLPVLRWQEGEASLFVGAALYPKDGRTFAAHVGDVVPIGGLQVRHRNVFMQLIPLDGNLADAVVTVGVTFGLE